MIRNTQNFDEELCRKVQLFFCFLATGVGSGSSGGKAHIKNENEERGFHTNFNFTNAIRALCFLQKGIKEEAGFKSFFMGDGILS